MRLITKTNTTHSKNYIR